MASEEWEASAEGYTAYGLTSADLDKCINALRREQSRRRRAFWAAYRNKDRTGGLCIPCATSFDCKAHPNQEESVGRFCRCGFREPCGRVGHCVNQGGAA